MPISGWPTTQDDSGTGTDGTPVDAAWGNAVRDAIEGEIFSETYPTQSPADTTDEVIAARNDFPSLDARLDDMDTHISGSVSAADSSSLSASENVARNPDLAGWKNGASAAPDSFVLSGTGAAVARVTGIGAGPAAARITYGSATAVLTQSLLDTTEFSAHAALGLDGRKLSITARVKCSLVDQARVGVTDGVTTTYSVYHTGSGQPENLAIAHPISGSATKLEFFVQVVQSGTADVAGFVVTFADNPATGWELPPRTGSRVLDVNTTAAGNVGAPETDLMVYKCAANLLRKTGIVLEFEGRGHLAANATSKTLKFKFGTLSFTLFAAGYNNKAWRYRATVIKTGASTQRVFVDGSVTNIYLDNTSTGTETDTSEIIAKFTGDANANNDIVQDYMKVTVLEPSAGI